MTLRRRPAAALAAAALACGALLPAVAAAAPGALAAGPAGGREVGARTVAVSVLDVSPTTPTPSVKPATVTVELQLTNTGDVPLPDLTVKGARGNPIANRQALDSAIAHPAPPDPTLAASFDALHPVTTSLAPGASATVAYVSQSSTSAAGPGLCLCENRVYPLYFAVHATVDGEDVVVGSAQTFIASFPVRPAPVRVGWVWPILEPPHRGARDDLFTDDDLAQSVSDGRLARLLAVAEGVGAKVPLTLVVDPELIDELAVMANGHYSVLTSTSGGTKAVPGTGQQAAQQWLARLQTLLSADPDVQLVFTPPSDPDVQTLTDAGLDWSPLPSTTAQGRISAALGDRAAPALLSWPAREALTSPAVAALAGSGVTATVLSASAIDGGAGGLVALPTGSGQVDALVPNAGVTTAARQVLSVGGPGAAALPQLVAQLAVGAVVDPTGSPFFAVVPPANLDPDPAVAERAILATARTRWSTGATLESAAAAPALPTARLKYRRVAPALPATTIATARSIAGDLPGMSTMFPTGTQSAFGSLPAGVQRSESAAWLGNAGGSAALAQELDLQLRALLNGVHVVRPADGTYTLGSADSPLPITVQNGLGVPVNVRVSVRAVGNIPGFSSDDIGVHRIEAGAKVALHVPVHVDRVGRIKVDVQLLTPANTPVGNPVQLSVRSTALGEIGKVITTVAGGVLALALLVRLLRALRRRQRGGGQPDLPPAPVRERAHR